MYLEKISSLYKRIDHLAIAVKDLNQSKEFFRHVLGLELIEERVTNGQKTGMISAVFSAKNFTIVLIQGLDDDSQVTRYIEQYGAGVQHVAFEVDDLDVATELLREQGMDFATTIIRGPGLRQVFSKREENSGMMFELIERRENEGFEEGNVNELFEQLESAELI